MKDDFRGLDAYLEKKHLEMHGNYLESDENYNNNMSICTKESNLKYSMNVHTNTQLHLLDDTYYSNSSIFSIENGKKPKLSSQEISKSFSLFKNDLVKNTDHASNNDIETSLETGLYLS